MPQLCNEWPHVSVVVGGKAHTQSDVEQKATIGAQVVLFENSGAWVNRTGQGCELSGGRGGRLAPLV
jgi:hypothetical protein